eukprot:gene17417-biopygen4248
MATIPAAAPQRSSGGPGAGAARQSGGSGSAARPSTGGPRHRRRLDSGGKASPAPGRGGGAVSPRPPPALPPSSRPSARALGREPRRGGGARAPESKLPSLAPALEPSASCPGTCPRRLSAGRGREAPCGPPPAAGVSSGLVRHRWRQKRCSIAAKLAASMPLAAKRCGIAALRQRGKVAALTALLLASRHRGTASSSPMMGRRACSGQALCGDFGSAAQQQFMVIGWVSSLVAVTERVATRWGVRVLVDAAVRADVELHWNCRLRDQVVYAKRGAEEPLLLSL